MCEEAENELCCGQVSELRSSGVRAYVHIVAHGKGVREGAQGGVVRAADRANVTECSEMRDEIKAYRHLYEEVLEEMRNPMP